MFDSIDIERNLRIQSRKNLGKGEIKKFSLWLEDWPDKTLKNEGLKALSNISNFSYNHSVLNKNTYLAHVLRVTKMCMKLQPQLASELLTLSMIHNIFEATNLSEIELLNYFDIKTLERVKILKIDRRKQCSNEYLTKYYSLIENSHISVSIVKIVDKIDNIFTLCLNPDELKRKIYLKQIENYVIPLTKIKLPQVLEYLKKLVDDAYKTKYIPIEGI